MVIKVNGKQEALQELEKAKKLLEEAEKILWKLPNEISLEITEGSNKVTDADSNVEKGEVKWEQKK